MSFLILFFLFLLYSTATPLSNEQTLTNLARSLFSEDLFLTHLSSDLANKSISPCDNFYRRVCPRDVPDDSVIWNKLIKQVDSIMNIYELLEPSPERLRIERIHASALNDKTDYSNIDGLTYALVKVGPANLARCFTRGNLFKYLMVKQIMQNQIEDKDETLKLMRFYERTVIGTLIEKLKRNKTDVINSLARHALLYMNEKNDKLRQDGINNNFESVLRDDTSIMRLMKSVGNDHVKAMHRMESTLTSVLDEYRKGLENAPWGRNENRFGFAKADILTKYVSNLTFAVFYSNQFSIENGLKESLLSKFERLLAKNYEELFDMAHIPRMRVMLARNFAIDEISEENLNPVINHRVKHKSRMMNAFAAPESERGPATVLINHILTMHTAHSAHLASMFGFTGYYFAHELYHQLQFAHNQYIDDKSEHENAKRCANTYMGKVCDRFNEVACSAGFTEGEDTADVYGIQIAYQAMKTTIGAGKLDTIVNADLQMTHRELFFSTVALGICAVDERAQWQYKKKDVHSGRLYRANGVLGLLPDFKNTFACYDDDLMAFPESPLCPVFSEELS